MCDNIRKESKVIIGLKRVMFIGNAWVGDWQTGNSSRVLGWVNLAMEYMLCQ